MTLYEAYGKILLSINVLELSAFPAKVWPRLHFLSTTLRLACYCQAPRLRHCHYTDCFSFATCQKRKWVCVSKSWHSISTLFQKRKGKAQQATKKSRCIPPENVGLLESSCYLVVCWYMSSPLPPPPHRHICIRRCKRTCPLPGSLLSIKDSTG